MQRRGIVAIAAGVLLLAVAGGAVWELRGSETGFSDDAESGESLPIPPVPPSDRRGPGLREMPWNAGERPGRG